MRINVHRGGNRGMAKHLTDYFGVHTEAHHQGGEGVAIVVQSGFQARFLNYFLGGMSDSTRVERRAIRVGKHQVYIV